MQRVARMTLIPLLFANSAFAAQSAVRLEVDMSSAGHPARSLEVNNDAVVIVDIKKTTFQSCTVDTKTETLAPPVSPLGQALAALNPFLGGAGVGTPPTPVPVPPADVPLDKEIAALEADVDKALTEVEDQRDMARSAFLTVTTPLACTDDACTNPDLAKTRLDGLRRNLGRVVDTPPAPVAVLNARAAAVSKVLLEKIGKPEEDAWVRAMLVRFDGIQRRLDAIADRRQSLGKAKDAILPLLERIDTFTPSTMQSVPITVARDAKSTLAVKCTNAVTLEPKVYRRIADSVIGVEVPPVSTTVVYQDMSWAIVTAGVLYSRLDKRQVGVAAFKTGSDESGADTFERRVSQTEHGETQIMPFTFLNIPVCRCRRLTPALAVGFGLNTNNGAKLLEYFVGGSVIIRKQVGIQIGRHIGSTQQPSNEFRENDVLPEKLTTVPTVRQRDGAFAIGLTFRIPLPK